MKHLIRLNLASLILAVFLMAGCGIDRGGIIDPLPTSPSDPGPTTFSQPGGATIGRIISIDGNQIVINDMPMDLTSTSIVVNGGSADSSSLIPGMIAVATSPQMVSLSVPTKLEVNFNLAGESVQVDPALDSFQLLGQTVDIAELDLASPGGMQLPTATPNIIAVSGLFTSSGVLVATAVSSYPDTQPVLVTGFTQQIDSVNSLFNIGPQGYDYSQVVSLTTPTGGFTEFGRIQLQVGPENSDGRFPVVTAVSAPLIDPTLPSGALVSLEGFVTGITDASSLQVSFQRVVTTDSTLLLGLPNSVLATDQLVRVSGSLDAEGIVVAISIQLLD